MAPDLLAGIEIPRLQLADMVGARRDREDRICRRDSGKALPRGIGDRIAHECPAQVVIGRDVEQPGLWAVGWRRPVFAAPQRRAELGLFTGPRLTRRVDIWSAGLGIEALEHVLLYDWLTVDEVDLVGSAFEHPQIAVAGHVDQTLHGPAVVLVIDKDRRVDLVPVP